MKMSLERIIQSKEVTQNPIQITTLSRTYSTIEMRSCHILFIGQSEQEQLPTILSSIQSLSILTISDIENFALQGGVIELYKGEQSYTSQN